jgi:hypothetical protein
VNTAIFEPRFEVMQDALINQGFFDAAPLILELLEEHRTGDCTARSAGTAKNRRRVDKSVVSIAAPFIGDLLNATMDSIDLADFGRNDGASPSAEPRAWGRSPITTWTVPLSSKTAALLDLSGLTGIQLGVKYAFYKL